MGWINAWGGTPEQMKNQESAWNQTMVLARKLWLVPRVCLPVQPGVSSFT